MAKEFRNRTYGEFLYGENIDVAAIHMIGLGM